MTQQLFKRNFIRTKNEKCGILFLVAVVEVSGFSFDALLLLPDRQREVKQGLAADGGSRLDLDHAGPGSGTELNFGHCGVRDDLVLLLLLNQSRSRRCHQHFRSSGVVLKKESFVLNFKSVGAEAFSRREKSPNNTNSSNEKYNLQDKKK